MHRCFFELSNSIPTLLKISRSGCSCKRSRGGRWGGEFVFRPGRLGFAYFYQTQDSLREEMCEFQGIDEFEKLQKNFA